MDELSLSICISESYTETLYIRIFGTVCFQEETRRGMCCALDLLHITANLFNCTYVYIAASRLTVAEGCLCISFCQNCLLCMFETGRCQYKLRWELANGTCLSDSLFPLLPPRLTTPVSTALKGSTDTCKLSDRLSFKGPRFY